MRLRRARYPRPPALAQEHALDELLRTLEARLSQFTEIRVRLGGSGSRRGIPRLTGPFPLQKRLQDREVRRAEYTMEAQNLENMHLRNMPVEATSKVGRATATPTAALRR